MGSQLDLFLSTTSDDPSLPTTMPTIHAAYIQNWTHVVLDAGDPRQQPSMPLTRAAILQTSTPTLPRRQHSLETSSPTTDVASPDDAGGRRLATSQHSLRSSTPLASYELAGSNFSVHTLSFTLCSQGVI
uniref:Uncharacterized protein n=1 Tax=Arundo donax TaxID=35708 RepID=A0A0A9DKM5_ARUDO